jgi:hypothetical protein
MAAPSNVEILNMQVWSVHTHYYKYRQMYVAQGRAIVAGIKTMLSKAPPQPLVTLSVSEDDIASAFLFWLMNDKKWQAYLAKKSHMTGPGQHMMTDTMARFIAWEAYSDLIK